MEQHKLETVDVTDETLESPPFEEKTRIATRETTDPVYDNLTEQQRERDKSTTKLYEQFVTAHKEKTQFSGGAKKAIRASCITWISLLFLVCIVLSAYTVILTERQTSDLLTLVSALVPIIVAIIGTLNIITKYVFPEDEDRHITEIVKAIHENDLKNKQGNIDAVDNKPDL